MNRAKAVKYRAHDLAVKASRDERARVKGGALRASEVMCQNNLRHGAWITDVTYGTGG
jgi:hypothetical protein